MFPNSIIFTVRLGDGRIEGVCGVTVLRNEIYILCRSYAPASHIIRVFEDRNSVRLIDIKKIRSPEDIGSSEKENCLYVSCNAEKFVWKITREAGNQHKIIRWLDIGHMRGDNAFYPSTISVSSDGRLLVFINSLPTLNIYGSDGSLTQSIQLPRCIEYPLHAVETSIGNVVIIHRWIKEKGENGSNWREWVVSELTSDGKMVIGRFIPSNEAQELKNPCYLSLDSEDRVFVADKGNGRVILLDSDLKWNQTICPTKEETGKEDAMVREPWRLCYIKEKKQLIVGGDFYLGEPVNVYTLS